MHSNPNFYPNVPATGRTDTSYESAVAIAPCAQTLRDQAFALLLERDSTADELAEAMNASILAVRPRVAEIVAKGKAYDSGARRRNSSGRSAIVWRAVREVKQESLF